MSEILTAVYGIAIFLVVQVSIRKTCRRAPALRRFRPALVVSSVLWGALVIAKLTVLSEVFSPVDGLLHERMARTVAEHLAWGNVRTSLEYLGVGNPGYQYFLGVFYWLSHAPEAVTYGINGAFGFCGLLALLEVVCRMTRCHRIPVWLVAIPFFAVTPMLWSTSNLKEGLTLWGICNSLRILLCYSPRGRTSDWGWACCGVLVAGFMRPHVMAAWLLAIGTGILISQRRFGIAAVAVMGAVSAFFILSAIRPETAHIALNDGAIDALEHGYETRADLGNTSIQYATGKPMFFISGLLLLLLRPLPHELNPIGFIVPGAEAWTLTCLLVFGWARCRRVATLLFHPFPLTMLISLVLFSIFFTYMYNMGLVVRYRLLVFPAILGLAAFPYLFYPETAGIDASRRWVPALRSPAPRRRNEIAAARTDARRKVA